MIDTRRLVQEPFILNSADILFVCFIFHTQSITEVVIGDSFCRVVQGLFIVDIVLVSLSVKAWIVCVLFR